MAFLFFLLSSFLSSAECAVPRLINYQGKLTDLNGVPLNGSYAITFRIYDSDAAGNLLWEEVHNGVVIDKGVFSLILGSVNPLGLAFDAQYYLEIKVGAEVMSPRQRIASVGYAIRAEKADVAEEAKTKGSSTDATPGYLNAKVKNSITIDNNQLQLVGDSASPGTSKFYATDASGNKGWQSIPLGIPSNIQVYSTPGIYTWTKPANVNKVYVKVWGGGGGGGGDVLPGSIGGTSSFAGVATLQATGGTGGISQAGDPGVGGMGSGGAVNMKGGAGIRGQIIVGGKGGNGGMAGGGGSGDGIAPGGGGGGGQGYPGQRYGASGGGGGGYSEGLVSVTGDVTVTVGTGGAEGTGGGSGGSGMVIVYY